MKTVYKQSATNGYTIHAHIGNDVMCDGVCLSFIFDHVQGLLVVFIFFYLFVTLSFNSCGPVSAYENIFRIGSITTIGLIQILSEERTLSKIMRLLLSFACVIAVEIARPFSMFFLRFEWILMSLASLSSSLLLLPIFAQF